MGGLQPPACEMSPIRKTSGKTSGSRPVVVPTCHGGVPNCYAPRLPFSAITIAIRDSRLGHFSRADLGHFSRALKALETSARSSGPTAWRRHRHRRRDRKHGAASPGRAGTPVPGRRPGAAASSPSCSSGRLTASAAAAIAADPLQRLARSRGCRHRCPSALASRPSSCSSCPTSWSITRAPRAPGRAGGSWTRCQYLNQIVRWPHSDGVLRCTPRGSARCKSVGSARVFPGAIPGAPPRGARRQERGEPGGDAEAAGRTAHVR
jgi:hypothetical protein